MMPTGDRVAHLRILATTDLHMNLLAYDYYADRPDHRVGLSRTARLIRAARAEAGQIGAATLLLDNGDGLFGTPLDDPGTGDGAHALLRCFAALGYDAIGLGNHDFDLGIRRLADLLAAAPCPVLCSNMHRAPDRPRLPFRKTALLERRLPGAGGSAPPVRIGLISLLPPQTMAWNAEQLDGEVTVENIVPAARRLLRDLRGDGADLVIALAHTGLGCPRGDPDAENALAQLAELAGLDAIVGGHTHLLLPLDGRTGLPVPTVMPGSAGSHLGQIDLTLAHSRQSGWRITGATPNLRAVSDLPDHAGDHELEQILAPLHRLARQRLQQQAGSLDAPLHSYFCLFAPDPSLAFVAAAQAAALRPVLAGAGLADLPLLSVTAPARFGGRAGPDHYTDIPSGAIRRRHLAELNPFPNLLRCLRMTGAGLRDWLEMSAGLFHRIRPGKSGQALIDPGRAGHNFDVIHGLTYQIDLAAPARFDARGRLVDPGNRRIHDLRHDGRTIGSDDAFLVATNSYRANGGGHFLPATAAPRVPVPDLAMADILRRYVSGGLPRDPLQDAPPPWRFCPQLGTRVSVRTGPGARPHLSGLGNRLADVHGPDDSGFLTLSLAL